ncbi:hypothetical protein SAMN02910357_02242 [Succinivibrio dextrinosolvens]|uniref:hypothetical protein n=1 Tax=Succinivibrio dextrinosolvens TaxID=83771 RepID=UPI0008E1E056|nr:hypothetical protein [Succinivibrio dextrinosolvens]SFS85571.1 hypothetical protein SAMN02910357_02242 [Succinivibrio dextrinosolvens]
MIKKLFNKDLYIKFPAVLFLSLFAAVAIEFLLFQKNIYSWFPESLIDNTSVETSTLEQHNLLLEDNKVLSLKDPYFIYENKSFTFVRGVYFKFNEMDSRRIHIKVYCSDENDHFSDDFIHDTISSGTKTGYIPVGHYSKNLKIILGKDYSKYSLDTIVINPKISLVVKNQDKTRLLRLSLVLLVIFGALFYRNSLKGCWLCICPNIKKLEVVSVCGYRIIPILTQMLLFFFFISYFSGYYSLISLSIWNWIYKFFNALLFLLAVYNLLRMLINRDYGFVLIAVVSGIILYGIYYLTNTEQFIYEFILLAVCCYRIGYRRILLSFVISIGLVISSEIILMLCGLLKDIAYVRELGVYRHSFGSIYPTDFACSILFVSLALWSILKHTHLVLSIAVLSVLIYFQQIYTHTRNTELVMCISILFVIIYSLLKNKKAIICHSRIISFSLRYSFVFLAALSLLLGILYDSSSSLMNYLDSLFSTRLSLVHSALNNYGISFMGQNILFVGNGGTLASKGIYNFIDSSYCLLLIRYGIAGFLVYAVLYIFTQKRVLECENLKLSIILLLIAVHSFTEHHYIEFFYNPCLLLIFSDVREKGSGYIKAENS